MSASVFLRVLGLLTTLGVGYQVLDYVAADEDVAYPLSGRVRVAGRPLHSGTVRFVSLANDRPTFAGAFVADGVYEIDGDSGLAPGRYQVQISGIGQEEHLRTINRRRRNREERDDARVDDPIPPHFNLQSRIQVEVAADGGVVGFDFDLN
jgi:hypothetical protein